MTYEEILARLQEYRSAVAGEGRLARAGLKIRPEYVLIRARHDDLFSEEALETARRAIEIETRPRNRERMERVMFALLEGTADKSFLAAEEALVEERARLLIETGEGRVPYLDAPSALVRTDAVEARAAIRAAQAAAAARLDALRDAREHALRQPVARFGFSSLREYLETRQRIRYEDLLAKALPILQETTGLYRRVMSDAIRRTYGLELGTIDSAHALHWRSLREFDRLFPATELRSRCDAALGHLGLSVSVHGIETDVEDRPGKASEPRAVAVRVPGEIHLQVRPTGTSADARDYLFACGQALALQGSDPALPAEWRAFPRSGALTSAFGSLFMHLVQNPLWLEHALRLPKAAADRCAAQVLLADLYDLRRLIALFTYEIAFDEKPYDPARNKALYAKTMLDLTGFTFEPEFYLEDINAPFAAADALRGRVAAAQLEEHLIRKLGDRWFLKRETGAVLRDLFAKGASWDAEELIASLGMTPWDALPLVRRFDGVARLLR